MDEKTKQALNKVLGLFRTGDVPEALSITLLPRMDVPSALWSINNRLLMFLNNTEDARGYKQWQLARRWVKKGAKAFSIICPSTVVKENKYGEREKVVIGFHSVPVFRVEDTEGEALKVAHLPPKILPPLFDVADRWGITVSWKNVTSTYYGRYVSDDRIIELATYDENVFLHELAHAAHEKVLGSALVEKWREEVVAELTAAVLGKLYGKRVNLGDNYKYISDYAGRADVDAYHACVAVVSDVSQCLNLILAEEEAKEAA